MDLHAGTDVPRVSLYGRIYNLPDLWEQKDDWTGVSGKDERKKRQNRLNQRAWRRRKRMGSRPDESSAKGKGISPAKEPHQEGSTFVPSSMHASHVDYDETASVLLVGSDRVSSARALIRQAYHDHMLHSPRPESLQMLIRVNILNAIARNALQMGIPITHLCREDYVSPVSLIGPCPAGLATISTPPSCPAILLPTSLQRTIKHHPWLDLFPFPVFRDNILQGIQDQTLDEDDLCSDVLEIWSDEVEGQRPALLIWGDPWDPQAWEVSLSFMRKWGRLLEGCPGLINATNSWRGRRGLRWVSLADMEQNRGEAK